MPSMALPTPPYIAVIFSSQRPPTPDDGYAETAVRMLELASQQPGFLGAETARDAAGFGLTVSYWADEEAVRAWKSVAEHRVAQERGNTRWYERYAIRVARVERAYEGPR
jgi:heme-degrading monooxygenase HmoA